jgi:hypothetical protein
MVISTDSSSADRREKNIEAVEPKSSFRTKINLPCKSVPVN